MATGGSGYRLFRRTLLASSQPSGVRRARNYHRTLSTYLNALLIAGFVLEAVAEPPAGPLLAQRQPLYRQVPMFFAARARSC